MGSMHARHSRHQQRNARVVQDPIPTNPHTQRQVVARMCPCWCLGGQPIPPSIVCGHTAITSPSRHQGWHCRHTLLQRLADPRHRFNTAKANTAKCEVATATCTHLERGVGNVKRVQAQWGIGQSSSVGFQGWHELVEA